MIDKVALEELQLIHFVLIRFWTIKHNIKFSWVFNGFCFDILFMHEDMIQWI